MLGEQDRHPPLLVEPAQQPDQLVAGDRVELRRRLVEQDQRRDESPGRRRARPAAARHPRGCRRSGRAGAGSRGRARPPRPPARCRRRARRAARAAARSRPRPSSRHLGLRVLGDVADRGRELARPGGDGVEAARPGPGPRSRRRGSAGPGRRRRAAASSCRIPSARRGGRTRPAPISQRDVVEGLAPCVRVGVARRLRASGPATPARSAVSAASRATAPSGARPREGDQAARAMVAAPASRLTVG